MNQNKAALVTGSAIRLGKHIALALAEKGYDIAIHYNSSIAPAEETAALIRSKGSNCALFPYNLQDADGIISFMEQVKTKFPNLAVW